MPDDLTKEEVDAILAEHDEDRREEAEAERREAEGFLTTQEEFLASEEDIVADLLAPDENGVAPRVAAQTIHDAGLTRQQGWRRVPGQRQPQPVDEEDSLEFDEPPQYGDAIGTSVPRAQAMMHNFRRNYGGADPTANLRLALEDMTRLAPTPEVVSQFPTDEPLLNTMWQHINLPAFQLQVTRTTHDVYTLRPIGMFRGDLPRVVQVTREMFWAWFMPVGGFRESHQRAEERFRSPHDQMQKLVKGTLNEPNPKPRAKPRSAWQRLLDDED